MAAKKIFGWVILLAGLVLIFWTVFTSYTIFTAQKEVPQIFKVEELTKTLPQEEGDTDVESQMREMIKEQFSKMFPSEVLPKLLNLIVWSIFAGIAIFAGSHISSLGIKLIKNT